MLPPPGGDGTEVGQPAGRVGRAVGPQHQGPLAIGRVDGPEVEPSAVQLADRRRRGTRRAGPPWRRSGRRPPGTARCPGPGDAGGGSGRPSATNSLVPTQAASSVSASTDHPEPPAQPAGGGPPVGVRTRPPPGSRARRVRVRQGLERQPGRGIARGADRAVDHPGTVAAGAEPVRRPSRQRGQPVVGVRGRGEPRLGIGGCRQAGPAHEARNSANRERRRPRPAPPGSVPTAPMPPRRRSRPRGGRPPGRRRGSRARPARPPGPPPGTGRPWPPAARRCPRRSAPTPGPSPGGRPSVARPPLSPQRRSRGRRPCSPPAARAARRHRSRPARPAPRPPGPRGRAPTGPPRGR